MQRTARRTLSALSIPIISPFSPRYTLWLGIVALSVIYNLWSMILRVSIDVDSPSALPAWLLFDYL
jgi:hypothetical protein